MWQFWKDVYTTSCEVAAQTAYPPASFISSSHEKIAFLNSSVALGVVSPLDMTVADNAKQPETTLSDRMLGLGARARLVVVAWQGAAAEFTAQEGVIRPVAVKNNTSTTLAIDAQLAAIDNLLSFGCNKPKNKATEFAQSPVKLPPVAPVAAPVVQDMERFSAPEQDEKYRSIMELGEQALCFVEKDGRVLYASRNWSDVADIDMTYIHDDGLSHRLHPHQHVAFVEKIRALLSAPPEGPKMPARKERLRCQIELLNGKGYQWLEFSMMRHREAADVCVVAARNVEREIETERTLRTAKIETEMAQKGRYEFLGHMSHELRTPLNAMMGFSEMMEHGVYGEVAAPEYKEYLSNIRESGHLLLNRINDMIEIVSTEVGNSALHEGQVLLEDLLSSARMLHRHDSFCRHVTVVMPEKLPRLVIRGDKAKLTRSLGNLLSNAIRFSPHESVVELQCEVLADESLIISVTDVGEGMSDGHLSRITDALTRPDCLFSQNPDSVGIGLGLTVAKEFVALHNGALCIESEYGFGTKAMITLPSAILTSLDVPRKRMPRHKRQSA